MSAPTHSHGSGRIGAVDMARGAAVIVMMAAHVSHAFLADAWQHNEIWYRINILFGFVAPAFTMLSGVTLWMALERRGPGAGTMALARRLGAIILLGYWLQIPVLSLRQLLFNHRPEELALLFNANILQVIGIAGLLGIALARGLGSMRLARWAALGLGAGAIVATPYVWGSGIWSTLPLPLGFYLAPQPPATFSLFPLLAYFMFGFGLSSFLTRAGHGARESAAILAAGGAMMAAGLLLDPLLHSHPPHDDFWGSSAHHALFRLGGSILLVGLCRVGADLAPGRWRWLEYIGRRSLAVYILHLMLFYGSPMNMGMRFWFDGAMARALHPLTALAILLATVWLCRLALRGWDRLKEREPELGGALAYLWWGVFWVMFLLSP